MKELIGKVVCGEDLTGPEMSSAVESMMLGAATPVEMAAFLTALRVKGETVDEITAAAEVMRRHGTPVHRAGPALDTCGTGGDATGTFNISTIAAFVLAAAGVPVAKHGNRALSSSCGSADVLEALGVNVQLSPARAELCLKEVGIAFLYAPVYHRAMSNVAPVRVGLGFRTIFNVLGPLVNPALAEHQLVGVYRRELAPVLAAVLGRLGGVRAMVVHGSDGLDEVTTTGITHVAELRNGRVREYDLRPHDFGLPSSEPDALKGGDVVTNAEIMRAVLGGSIGPQRDVVLANAAAGLMVAGRVADLRGGVALAALALDSGAAAEMLRRLVEVSNR